MLVSVCFLTGCKEDTEAEQLAYKQLGEKVVTKTEKILYNERIGEKEARPEAVVENYVNHIGYSVVYKGRINVIVDFTEYYIADKEFLYLYDLTAKDVYEEYKKYKKEAEAKGNDQIELSEHSAIYMKSKRYQYVYTDKGKLLERVEL